MAERQAVKRGLILAAFVVVVFVSAGALVLWLDDRSEARARHDALISARVDFALCVESRKNRAAIRKAILGGDPTLLQPGDYGYTYAREHPLEAEIQHEKIVAGNIPALKLFPPIECPPDPDTRR